MFYPVNFRIRNDLNSEKMHHVDSGMGLSPEERSRGSRIFSGGLRRFQSEFQLAFMEGSILCRIRQNINLPGKYKLWVIFVMVWMLSAFWPEAHSNRTDSMKGGRVILFQAFLVLFLMLIKKRWLITKRLWNILMKPE